LRFTFVVAAYLVSTPLSSAFARLASGAFYFAIPILTFYEIIIITLKKYLAPGWKRRGGGEGESSFRFLNS
jgi:hypothetical protein